MWLLDTKSADAVHCSTLQHAAIHCIKLHHTAPHLLTQQCVTSTRTHTYMHTSIHTPTRSCSSARIHKHAHTHTRIHTFSVPVSIFLFRLPSHSPALPLLQYNVQQEHMITSTDAKKKYNCSVLIFILPSHSDNTLGDRST